VDLHGEIARQVEQRLLERADRVGGQSAQDYLTERIDALKDRWEDERDRGAILGYRKEKKKDHLVTGLLRRADGSRWDELTVPMSMRETENEINLLLPGGGNLVEQSTNGGPAWQFGAAGGDSGEDADRDGELAEPVDADEYGAVQPAERRR
jgi:hypothetical protein